MGKPNGAFLSVATLLSGALMATMVACTPKDDASASLAAPPAPPPAPVDAAKPQPDRSGRTRVGVASFYADRFAGRPMADGTPMDPVGDNAASRTLPLGTTAKVTNISTGQSAVVTIQDRGPYAKGRLVDLSPTTARKIGISPKKGVSRVRVSPIAVPLPDGRVKPGVAAQDPDVPQLKIATR